MLLNCGGRCRHSSTGTPLYFNPHMLAHRLRQQSHRSPFDCSTGTWDGELFFLNDLASTADNY